MSFAALASIFFPKDYTMITAIAMTFHVLLYPIISVSLMIATDITIFKKSKRYPRPYPRWAIPFWGFVYLLPAGGLYFFVIYIYSHWM